MALKLLLKFIMARRLLLFSTICSLFVLGYFTPRWIGPQNCINSSLVEEITVMPEKQKLQSCDLQEVSFAAPPPLRLQNLKLLSRIANVEFVSEYWGTPKEKISIIVEKDMHPKLFFRDNHFIISEGMLAKTDILEKSLLQYWQGSADFMSAEVVSDVMLAIQKGVKKFQPKAWLKSYSSLERYCQRGLNILQHEEFCSIQNEMQDSLVSADMEVSPVLWSLHNVVAEVLIEGFYDLSLTDKQKFLQNIIFINGFDDLEGLLDDTDKINDLADLDARFEVMFHYAVSPLDVGVRAFTKPILRRLSGADKSSFDYVYIADDVDPNFRSTYFSDDKNVILEYAAEKYLYPSDIDLNTSRAQIFSKLPVGSITYIGCDLPRPRRILEFEAYAKQVLFVKVCDDVGQIQEMIETGAQKFVRVDSEIEFVEFNISALRFAAQKRGELRSSLNLNSWKNWLQWQDYVFEADRKAYRPKAVYDAVSFFRNADITN